MPTFDQHSPKLVTGSVTISDGETESGGLDLRGVSLVGLRVPSGFDGSSISFNRGDSLEGTYQALQLGNGLDHSVTVAAQKDIALDPSLFLSVRFLKLVAGTPQTGDTTIELICAPVL